MGVFGNDFTDVDFREELCHHSLTEYGKISGGVPGFRVGASSRCMSRSFVKVIEFAETQVLEEICRSVSNAPTFSGQCVLVPDDGGNARDGKLQIGHMNAADIDVVRLYETISGVVDA